MIKDRRERWSGAALARLGFVSALACAGWTSAWAAVDLPPDLAPPLAEDQVFYRWQSTTSGENLARAGRLTAAGNAHFMNMTVDETSRAGAGLYLANTELSSARYLPAAGGNLLEARVAKGTRVLDLTDPKVVSRLRALGVSENAILDGAHAEGGLVIKYAENWYVGKNLTDKVHFELYPSARQSPARIFKILDDARAYSDAASKQLVTQIRNRRPDTMTAYTHAEPLQPSVLRTMPTRDLAHVLTRALEREPSERTTRDLLEFARSDGPALEKLRVAAPAVHEALAASLVRATSAAPLEAGDFEALASLVLRADGDPARRERRVKDLIWTLLAESENHPSALSERAARLRPLLAEVRFTGAERTRFAERLRDLTTHSHYFLDEATSLAELARAGGVKDADLDRRIERIRARHADVAKAVQSNSVRDVNRALRNPDSMGELSNVLDRLGRSVPDREIASALHPLVAGDPATFNALLRHPDDFRAALALDVPDGVDVFARTYAAAARADEFHRVTFLEHCLSDRSCVGRLDEAVRRDGGRIFKNLSRPQDLGLSVVMMGMSDRARARDYALRIVRGQGDKSSIRKFLRAATPNFSSGYNIDREVQRRFDAIDRLARRRNPTACLSTVIDAVD